MPNSLRILCVHGLGDQRQSNWDADWSSAIKRAVGANADVELDFRLSLIHI